MSTKPLKHDEGNQNQKINSSKRVHKAKKYPEIVIVKNSRTNPHFVCVRVTMCFCVCGAAVGFCLLIAGGVGKHQAEHTKVLVYIGILIFLVGIFLLVIMCSSWGTGGVYPLVEKSSNNSLYECICEDRVAMTCSAVGGDLTLQEVVSQNCNIDDNKLVKKNLIHDGVVHLQKEKTCEVKNCECLLRTPEVQIGLSSDYRPNEYSLNDYRPKVIGLSSDYRPNEYSLNDYRSKVTCSYELNQLGQFSLNPKSKRHCHQIEQTNILRTKNSPLEKFTTTGEIPEHSC